MSRRGVRLDARTRSVPDAAGAVGVALQGRDGAVLGRLAIDLGGGRGGERSELLEEGHWVRGWCGETRFL